MTLQAGTAEITITPPVGVELAGYGFGPSVGLLEELKAQALVLATADTAAALVSVDVLTVGQPFVDRVRSRVAAQVGIPGAHIIIAATHSHSSPTAMPLRQWGRVDAAYAQWLEDALVQALCTAWERRAPARCGWASGTATNLSENRRAGQEQIDAGVPVLRFDSEEGAPLAVVTNFACHPVSLHSYRNLISPDYPGTLRAVTARVLHDVLGTEPITLFTLGAAGDINPAGYVPGGTTPARSRQIGAILGCEVAKAALDPSWLRDPDLRVATGMVNLPVVPLPPVNELEAMRDHFAAEAARLDRAGAPWAQISEPEIQRDWAADALALQEAGTTARSVPCEVTALRLGEVAIVALPLEVFVETGLAIKAASPAALTLISTNTNGGVGYLPTLDAYEGSDYTNPQGMAPKIYGIHALAPEAEPLLRARAGELLQALFT